MFITSGSICFKACPHGELTECPLKLAATLVLSPAPPSGRGEMKEGLGNNPIWKCPERRNSVADVDNECWPQLQRAKPLVRKL